MTYIIFFLITTILHLLLLNNAKKIANYLNLNDEPDNVRKFQHQPIPLIGGIIIFLVLLLNLFFFKFSDSYFTKDNFIYFLVIVTLIGLADDKYDLSANFKFFLTIFVFFVYFYTDKNLVINELRFSSFTYIQNIHEIISIPITILCCLLLTNSINMIDGKNGLCTTIQIIILLFLAYYILKQNYIDNNEINLKNEKLILIFLYSCFLLIFLFFNLRGLVFLGDAGSYLGSFIIIYLILGTYSKNNLLLNCEQIFFLLILPGIDMLRVFIYRIINKKNPFKADNEHFHNLLEIKFDNHKKITFIIGLSLFIPNLMINLFPTHMLIFLIIYLSAYFVSINYLYKNKLNINNK